MVFADVTDSLQGDEFQAVDSAISDIFDRAPENATVVVYPIEPNMAYVGKLSAATIPFRHNSGPAALERDAKIRADLAKEAIDKVAAVAKVLPPRVAASCLAGALQRAATDIASLGDRPVDIVFISDLVEECDSSIGGRKIMLNHPHIEADIILAQKLPGTFADLRKANVFLIYPTGTSSGFDIKRRRAGPDELKAFWNAVLSHCDLQSKAYFLAGTGYYHSEWKSAKQTAADAASGF
jgi:hypothetical protein